MTRLERAARVRREVDTRFGAVVVEMRAEGLYLREKGKRTAYGPLSWDSLFIKGADMHAQAHRRARKQKSSLRVGMR